MQLKNDRAAWLKGSNIRCAIPGKPQTNPYRLVLLGAPGVGKGTQAELLSRHLGACHLSTGDIFRAAIPLNDCNFTNPMSLALACVRRGELVSDDTMLSLIGERLRCLRCCGGFLLDGFPRTVAQATALEKLLASLNRPLNAVISYDLPLDETLTRLSGRRTCSKCKIVFHLKTKPPQFAGICDHCGGELIRSEDDRPEIVRVRMGAYQQSNVPLVKFYWRRGLLVSIAAKGSPEEIFSRTLAALKINPVSRALVET